MNDQLRDFLAALEEAGCRPRRSGDSWVARCPCEGHRHDDRNPSLSISEGRDQPVVTNCHTFDQHTFEAVCEALRRDPQEYMRESEGFDPPKRSRARAKDNGPVPALDDTVLAAMWTAKRWTRAACDRLGVGFDGERITFAGSGARYLPDPLRLNGQPKMLAAAGSKRGLWPAVGSLDGPLRWIVEGEPDAVTGNSAGLPCVGVPGTNGWKPAMAKQFDGLDVVLNMDCDLAGRRSRERIAGDLLPVAKSVRVLDLAPQREDGYDLTDALTEGVQTEADLLAAGELLTRMALQEAPLLRPAPDGLFAVMASTVEARKVEWLWPGRVPLSALTLLTGMPGLGKSMLTCELAGRVTRDGGHVLMVSAEDAWDFVLRPRLEATQAVLKRVHFVAMRREGFLEGLVLPDDVHALGDLMELHQARLVIVDPLMAHLNQQVSSLIDQHVRVALAPLARMAEVSRASVLAVHHLNKNASTDPMLRIGGSIGIPAAARSALLMDRNPDDPDGAEGSERVLAHVKSNFSRLSTSLLYRVESTALPDRPEIETARLDYIGESPYDAGQLLGQTTDPSERTELADAMDWLAGELETGPIAVKLLTKRAKEQGISERTLRRAKEQLRITSERIGFGTDGIWSWRLPDDEPESDGDA